MSADLGTGAGEPVDTIQEVLVKIREPNNPHWQAQHLALTEMLVERVEMLERKTDAIDEAQSMKLCQVREELDRLQGHSDGEQPTGSNTTSANGSTCESGEPERIRFEDIQKDMAEYHKTLREYHKTLREK